MYSILDGYLNILTKPNNGYQISFSLSKVKSLKAN